MQLIILLLSFFIFTQTTFSGEKKVLCEIFTSTTCGPCASQNPPFDNWIANYEYADLVTVIKYHVWWPSPGNDPYYLANISENTTRNDLYSNNYAPHGFVDGTIDAGSSYSSWAASIEGALMNISPLTLNVSGNLTSSGGTVYVNIYADGVVPNTNLILHTVVVEKDLFYTGPNGDPHHEYVMRKMFPSASGQTFQIQQGQTVNLQSEIVLDESWDLSKLEVVTFVQIPSTNPSPSMKRKVLQSGKTAITDLIMDVNENTNLPNKFSLKQNYPNPFNPKTKIKYAIAKNGFVSLKVFDVLGREIKTLVNESQNVGTYEIDFDANNLNSGIYFYKLTTNNFSEMKKMILVK